SPRGSPRERARRACRRTRCASYLPLPFGAGGATGVTLGAGGEGGAALGAGGAGDAGAAFGGVPVGLPGVPGVADLSSEPAPPTGDGPVPAPVGTIGAAGRSFAE